MKMTELYKAFIVMRVIWWDVWYIIKRKSRVKLGK